VFVAFFWCFTQRIKIKKREEGKKEGKKIRKREGKGEKKGNR
jgi:hypothetical protein